MSKYNGSNYSKQRFWSWFHAVSTAGWNAQPLSACFLTTPKPHMNRYRVDKMLHCIIQNVNYLK